MPVDIRVCVNAGAGKLKNLIDQLKGRDVFSGGGYNSLELRGRELLWNLGGGNQYPFTTITTGATSAL